MEVEAGHNWVTLWGALGAKIRATNAIGEELPFLM